MIIIFFDTTMLLIFLVLVVSLGVKAVSTLNGIIAALAVIIFIAETIFLVGANLANIFRRENRTIGGMFKLVFALISSAVCIYISYLFMADLQGYTDELWDLLGFVFALFVGGAVCLCQLAGACSAIELVYMDSSEIDGDFIKSILMQVGSAAFMYWLCSG